jgi:diguanylate cyclase (GGDEF)-like protein
VSFYPSDRGGALRALAPFVGTVALAWLTVPIGTRVDWLQYTVSAGLVVLAVGVRLGPEWARRSPWSTVPSLIFLAALGLLRNSAGGISSSVGVFALVPVFFTALHGQGRRELYVVLAGLAAFFLVPLILVGPPDYPHTQYRGALLSLAVGAIVGGATLKLVAGIRRQAAAANHRQQMLEELSATMRSLYSSRDARAEVCRAAKEIGGATCALIYETVAWPGVMRATAMIGMQAAPVELDADRQTAVRDAFLAAAPLLLTENVRASMESLEMWRSAGSPESVLYEPLMRGDEAIGVLVVAWSEVIEEGDPRLDTVKLLAHEAANVIHRADLMDRLSNMAQTDPLTGLPNRRAWDASVKQAVAEGQRVTIAMLDFDHFKEYNDTRGHPAGDRLLKQTAAMWLRMLRTGDLLARLGGEEFGLLLLDCDIESATDIIERLRTSIYGDQTCSVGFAQRAPHEQIELVMARADSALYEAKNSGRDRACISA